MENQILFDLVSFSYEFKNIVRTYIYDTIFKKITKCDYEIISKGIIEDPNGNIEKIHPFTGETKKFKQINQMSKEFWRELKNGGLNSYLPPTQQFIYDMKVASGFWFIKNPTNDQIYDPNFFDTRQLKAIAFDIETEVIRGVPDPKIANERIISCSFAYEDKNNEIKKIVAYLGEDTDDIEGIQTIPCETEEELIQIILKILFVEPFAGIIVGFNSKDFDIPYILKRAEKLKIPTYYDLHPEYIELQKHYYWDYPHIDIYRIYSDSGLKNYLFKGKYTRNTLREIALDQLKDIEKLEIDFKSHDLKDLITYNARDSEITLLLFKKAIDPLLLLSRVSKTPLSIIQNSSISTWVKNVFDFMLLDNGFFLLSKYQKKLKEEAESEGEQDGGLVLKPPQGVFKNVACFDFSSEYPTIVISQNLSFENVNMCSHEDCPISLGSDLKVINNNGILELEKRKDPTKVCKHKKGLFAQWMETLRNYRVNFYKKLSKTDPRYVPWSEGIKLFMNSSIGVFGSKNFEYHSQPLFNAVTRMGQYSLFNLKSLIETLYPEHKVIYGATDSIFVLPSDLEKIKRDAPIIIDLVKKRLNLDLEYEKTFEILFFSGAKSNYLAFHKDSLKSEVKGLSLHKSSTFEFNRKKFDSFIESLKTYLKNNPNWDTENITSFIKDEINKYIKELTESTNPIDFMFSSPYKDQEYKSNPPHRQALKRMTESEKKKAEDSGIIKYYKAKDGYYPTSQFKKQSVDLEKYIELLLSGFNQITKSLGLDLEKKSISNFESNKNKSLLKFESNKKESLPNPKSESIKKESLPKPKSSEKESLSTPEKRKSLFDFL